MKSPNTPMFGLMLIMSTMITISSSSWVSMWMGLEINLMSFLPLIKNSKQNSPKSMMIYFLVQSMSSLMLLFLVLSNSLIMETPAMMKSIASMAVTMSLLIKLGAAPMHMWVPEVMNKMSWNSCIVMMTWQKVAPMSMISHLIQNNKMMTTIVMATITIGAIGGLNQTSLRKIMAYSSISHLGWMLMLMMYSNMWMVYLTLYSIMVTVTCLMFNKNNLYYMPQMMMSITMQDKLVNSINMMSLGGLPPMMGFIPKWLTIMTLVENNIMLVTVMMCFMSLVTLMYYLRMISPMLMLNYQMNKWMPKKTKSNSMKMMTASMMLPIFLILNLM